MAINLGFQFLRNLGKFTVPCLLYSLYVKHKVSLGVDIHLESPIELSFYSYVSLSNPDGIKKQTCFDSILVHHC